MSLRRFLPAGLTLGLLAGLGIVATYGAMEVSSKPAVCGSCHIMEPYYDSWVTSSHANIACVECHIPPGVTAELRKKYEALSMVTSYFTGSYGTRPWAEVDDAACLQCHQRRLLSGKELYGDVLFDHTPHLTELRRGKRLRCTSCHAQIVQGSHITVTPGTCMLCHFKDQQPGTGTAACEMCHEVPQGVVDAGGLAFDHSDVSRFGMDCVACHAPADPSAGSVARERCLICHSRPDTLAEFENGDLLHQTHVTDHKIECTNCHLEIEHVRPPHGEQTEGECQSCHASGGHSPQRDLYAGIGGKGVAPKPDVMFRAGVRCEGCHIEEGDTASRAGEVACMSCHGPGYRTIYQGWQRALEQRSASMRRQLDQTLRAVGAAGPQSLDDALSNVRLVERGVGIHNPTYSLAILEAAHRQINEARQELSLESLAKPWPDLPYDSSCTECHLGQELASGTAFGRLFSHETHTMGAGLECESCHRSHEERERTGLGDLRFDSSGCQACHHQDPSAECLSCHGGVMSTVYSVELGEFDHSAHVEDMEIACGECHTGPGGSVGVADLEYCSNCH
jgi:nitrate/TMAO reductase-like tetraheme cytochrome c subunit